MDGLLTVAVFILVLYAMFRWFPRVGQSANVEDRIPMHPFTGNLRPQAPVKRRFSDVSWCQAFNQAMAGRGDCTRVIPDSGVRVIHVMNPHNPSHLQYPCADATHLHGPLKGVLSFQIKR